MKAEELKGKTEDELNKMLLDLKKQQFNMRFQLSQGQTENTAQIRANRRDIARVKTFMSKVKAGLADADKAKSAKPKAAKKATRKSTKAA